MKRPAPPVQLATFVLMTVRPFQTTVSSLLVIVTVKCCQQHKAAPTVLPTPPKGPCWRVLTLSSAGSLGRAKLMLIPSAGAESTFVGLPTRKSISSRKFRMGLGATTLEAFV